MTKVTLTKMGEVWCSAGILPCDNCVSECRNYHFIECEYIESKEYELCRYFSDDIRRECTNKDSECYGYGCTYDVTEMEHCRDYKKDDEVKE